MAVGKTIFEQVASDGNGFICLGGGIGGSCLCYYAYRKMTAVRMVFVTRRFCTEQRANRGG